MSAGYIDTNVLLRVLLADHPEQLPAVARWFAELGSDARPRVAAATVSEVIHVIAGPRLNRPRRLTADLVRTMLALPAHFDDREVIIRALDLFANIHPDWDDCLVAAYALARAHGVVHSFDQGFDRIPGVTRIEPGA